MDSKNRATCDQTEEIGAYIQKNLNGQNFRVANFKEKIISSLKSLYSSIQVEKENVSTNTIFTFAS